ncbi:MAG: glycoside hydrolase family 20 protein [Rikenellaceae bacterium]
MNKLIRTVGLIALAISFAACSPKKAAVEIDYQVIPAVKEMDFYKGAPFVLSPKVKIVYPGFAEELESSAQFLASYLKDATGLDFAIEKDGDAKGNIILRILESNEDSQDSYTMLVIADGLSISAQSLSGIFYGIQTLRKSLPATFSPTITLPSAVIKDSPRFGYRGVHLDVARHFYGVDEIKKFIDMMALHNMNKLHWHLTDDQGWRIEIKKYPLLTEIGSKRKETVIGRNSGQYDGKPYSGFYTQEQIKEIVEYAADRFITIIPEIDLPGHVQAALSAYPEYGCTGGPYEPWTEWGVSDHVLCAGNDKALTFVDDIFDEIIELFPSKYIHIGGDECPKTQWAKCPKCQARIRALGIKGDSKHTKEEYLQSYVIKHVEKHLNSKGRHIIGWDEILEGGLSETATVMSWRGETGGIEAAQMGNDVIMTPNTYLYFDYYQSPDTNIEPLAIGGYLPLEKVYSYEPMPESLNEEEQKRIIGVQANHWSEYLPTYEQVEYMSLPRWAALAEIQWSDKALKSYDYFLTRLPHLITFYDKAGYNYATHIYDVHATFTPNSDKGVVEARLQTIDDAPIHYTLDGSEPSVNSPKYKGAVLISESCQIKAASFRNGKSSRVFSENINFSKSTTKKITAHQPINRLYEFEGIGTLVDGLKGDGNYKTGRWIGFVRSDLDVTIDLGEADEISSVALTTCVEKGDWIFDVRSLSIKVSEDGENFTEVYSKKFPAMKSNDRNGLYQHNLTFDKTKARYVKVFAESEKSMPAWHTGKGNPGYIFVDEIEIN